MGGVECVARDRVGRASSAGVLLARAFGVALLIVASAPAAPAQVVNFPKLEKDRVYLLKSGLNVSAYETLESQIIELEKGTPQKYYTVILDSAGPGRYATRDYANALFKNWSGQPGFDRQRSVVIVAALGETPPKVAMHPGKELQDLGLRETVIQRDLIEQPGTVELARNKKFPEAIASLVRSTQSWIAEAESGRTRSRTAEREFSAQVRKEAGEAIATADRSLDETTKVLEEKRSAGLGVQGIEARVNQARTRLGELRGQVDADPRNVLAQAIEVQHGLEQDLARLRGLPGLQNQATSRVESLGTQLAQFEDGLEEAQNQGLAIGPVQLDFQKVASARDEARKAIGRDPEVALTQVDQLEARLKELQARLTALPAVHAERLAKAREVEAKRARLDSELNAGRKVGAPVEAIRKRFDQNSATLAAAAAPEVDDESKALATLKDLDGRFQVDIQQTHKAREQHVLLSRTLPLGLIGGLIALIGLVVGGFWFIRNRKHSEVDRQYKTFRTRATQVMETLDQLKERHRMLPATDPDFAEPIRGQTLALYMAAQERIKALWDRWLQSMDNLERAQKLISQASALGTDELRQAEELVRDEKPFEEIGQQMQEVTGVLDQLGQAHEGARARLKTIEEGRSALAQRLGALEGQSLPIAPYQADRDAVSKLVEQAKAELTPDPISSQALLQTAQERLDVLRQRAEDVAQRSEQGRTVLTQLDAARGLVAKRRSEGLKLDESGGNPDEFLAQARQAHAVALDALKAADPSAAGPALDQATARLGEARQTMDRVAAAQSAVAQELPARRDAQQTLLAELSNAAHEQAELERDFDRGSWNDVASNLDQARKQLDTAAPLLERAASLGSTDKQQYLECQRVLAEATAAQGSARSLRAGVKERRDHLTAVRTECQGIWPDLVNQGQSVAAFVDGHGTVVGAQAKAALTEALQLQRSVEQKSARPRPNWLEIQTELARVREGLAIAREQAEADVKAQDEVARKLAQLQPRMNQVGELLRTEDKDRPPSNIRYKSAAAALDRIERELAAGPQDWTLLLKQLDQAVLELNHSEELARQDVALANQALSEIDSARRSVRMAQGYSALGVSADVRLARAQLEQAERAMQTQGYEHAIQLATSADQAAKTAYNEANRQAAYRQQGIESERRRRAAEQMARQTGRLPTPGGLPPSMWEIGVGSAIGSVLGNILSSGGGGGFGSGGGGGFGTGGDSGGGGQGSWGGGSDGGDTGGGQGSW
jgi:hypothetical protein